MADGSCHVEHELPAVHVASTYRHDHQYTIHLAAFKSVFLIPYWLEFQVFMNIEMYKYYYEKMSNARTFQLEKKAFAMQWDSNRLELSLISKLSSSKLLVCVYVSVYI